MDSPLVLIILSSEGSTAKYSISIGTCSIERTANYECECEDNAVDLIMAKSVNHIAESYKNPNINLIQNGRITFRGIHMAECKKYTITGINSIDEIRDFFFANVDTVFEGVGVGEEKIIKRIYRRKVIIRRQIN